MGAMLWEYQGPITLAGKGKPRKPEATHPIPLNSALSGDITQESTPLSPNPALELWRRFHLRVEIYYKTELQIFTLSLFAMKSEI